MTNEEHTEETLHDAFKDGIADEVLTLAREIRTSNSKLDFDSAIQMAYNKLKP